MYIPFSTISCWLVEFKNKFLNFFAGKTKKPKLCAAKWTFVWYEPKIRENELARNPSEPRLFKRLKPVIQFRLAD
jgi:hypothetical protein